MDISLGSKSLMSQYLCRISRQDRKSRKKEFLRIKYSDPGSLLEFLRQLYNSGSIVLQVKLNVYLQKITAASVSFIVEESNRTSEAFVRVIGTIPLPLSLIFQANNPFLTRLRSLERPVEIAKCFFDQVLLENISDLLFYSYGTTFKNCYIFPIFHPYTTKVIFYCGLINLDVESSPLSYYHGLVGECFRYCHSAILVALKYDEERHYHRKYKDIMKVIMGSSEDSDNFSSLVRKIKKESCAILDAQRCDLFLVQGKEVVSYITDFGQGFECSEEHINVRIPLGVGIVGTVADTGEIINCTNTEDDSLYVEEKACLGKEGTYYNRNVLAFPLIAYRRVIGVVEARNKKGFIHFNTADSEFAKILGKVFGILVHLCLEKKKLWDALNRRVLIDSLFFKDNMKFPGDEANEVLNCKQHHEYPDFLSYSFLPANVRNQDVLCVCLRMFEEDDLLSSHHIQRTNFVRLLTKIKSRHHGRPLHNWQHSFSTFHFLKVIIKNEKLLENDQINLLELLCMYLAALCHGMESRGSTTPFQPTAGTTLACLYSTPGSLLQIYTLTQIIRIMESNENNIVESMDIEKYRQFVKCLDQALSYMDLANHITHKEDISHMIPKYNSNDSQHRQLMHSLILTCAALSDYCKPFGYCDNFSDLSLEEFFNKDLSECSGAIDLEGFQIDIELKKVELQIHFTKTICAESFRLLRSLFPRTLSCHEAVMENEQQFVKKREEVLRRQIEDF